MPGGELLQLHVGGCGNRVGARYWERTATEHGLDSNCQPINQDQDEFPELREAYQAVSFDEVSDGRYEPRCVCSDMDILDIEFMAYGREWERSGLYDGMARQSTWRDSGLKGNWAKGYYGEGVDLTDSMLDCMRRRLEACERPEAINLCAGLGGGDGRWRWH